MGNTLSTCPECSETRSKPDDKCLSTNDETGAFLCHHCGFRGHKRPNGSVKISKKTEELPQIDKFAPTEKVFEYFESRGISREVVIRNQIGYNGKEIMFPYLRDGKLINVKYRTHDKKFRQTAGAEKIFYGLDDLNVDYGVVIIVEGEMDKLAFEEAGYKNVISVPDGAPSPTAKSYESKFSYLENCEKELEHIKHIVVAVDNDAPGKKLETELIRRLGPERCWRIEWPKECKDANGVLSTYGEFEIVRQVEAAEPVPIAGIFTANDVSSDLFELYEKGQPSGDCTGWHSLDQCYTVKQGQMTIVTGIPSHGKSEFIDALMINLAMKDEWRFGVFSPENYPLHAHLAKLAQKHIEKPFSKSYSGHMTRHELETSQHWLHEHFVLIAPPDDELSIDHLLVKAKVAVLRHGIKGLTIDPWNEIDHSRPSGKNETEYISECLTKIRRFARMYNVHVWIVAHPTKLQRDRDGNYPVPTPYDISGSAHFRNKADNCITVWRDTEDEEKLTEIHVQKIRFKEIGKIGMVELRYSIGSGRYYDK